MLLSFRELQGFRVSPPGMRDKSHSNSLLYKLELDNKIFLLYLAASNIAKYYYSSKKEWHIISLLFKYITHLLAAIIKMICDSFWYISLFSSNCIHKDTLIVFKYMMLPLLLLKFLLFSWNTSPISKVTLETSLSVNNLINPSDSLCHWDITVS